MKITTKTTGRPSLTRVTLAVFTFGLSIPFIGIRRKNVSVTRTSV